jgi:hypothetical protein
LQVPSTGQALHFWGHKVSTLLHRVSGKNVHQSLSIQEELFGVSTPEVIIAPVEEHVNSFGVEFPFIFDKRALAFETALPVVSINTKYSTPLLASKGAHVNAAVPPEQSCNAKLNVFASEAQ